MPWLRLVITWLSIGLAACSAKDRASLVRGPSGQPARNSFDLQVLQPPTPVAVAGAQQLIYEIFLTNQSDDALVLTGVQVLDQDDRLLTELRGDDLTSHLGGPGVREHDRLVVAPGQRVVLYLDFVASGRALHHRVAYTAPGNDSLVVDGAWVEVGTTPPVVLGPPVRGGPWAAIHHPSWPRGHRRVLYTVNGRAHLPGRYAIDWIQLDHAGRFARDDDRVDTWFGYGADVLAVADGIVAAARDDVAQSDTVSGQTKHALGDATGNYLALELGHGRVAFYEHLKPGSLRVRVGQLVHRGDVIAALGFTGDSTGPHLHFHVADAAAPLDAEGVPYVFEAFDVLGDYPSMALFGQAPWHPLPTSRRMAEWPAPNVVVQFLSR